MKKVFSVLSVFGLTFAAMASINVKPGDSLIAARDAARKLPKPGVVELASGIYPLTDTLVLTAEDSDVTWRAAKGAKPVVTGGRRVTGWTKNADGTWSAAVPKGKPYRLLTVNGVRAVRCRAPNRGEFLAAGETEKLGINHTLGDGRHPKLVYDPKDIDFAKLSDPEAGEIRIFHWWVDSHLKIGSVDAASNTVTFAIPANKYTGKMSAGGKMCRYVAENFRSLLDQPGEWYLDAAAGRIDYLPRPGENLAKVEVLLAETAVLVRLDGDPTDEAKRVRNVTFSGIAFADAHAELSPKDPINDEQGSALIGAAIAVGGARNVTFEDCLFRDLCGYAVDVVDGSRNIAIRRSPMLRLGAGAVRADGAAANGDPRRMTRGVTVEDCEIGPYGLDWASAVGVLVKNAAGCRIAHNRIHDGFYTAVSLGWNWGYADSVARDNVVEWNVIEDIGKGLLNDMGGIYTLGLSPGTVIRGNVIRRIGSWSYGGHALYQDEGSQGILVEKNLLVDSPEPIGIHYAREVTYRNNIFAFHTTSEYMVWCGFHEHHVTAYFYDNIFYYTHGVPLGGGLTNPKPYEFPTNPRAVQLGGKVPIRTDHVKADWNLYYNPNGREAKADAALWDGHENQNSVFADPKFVDVKGGDFRLKSDSPAFALGFEPVDWSKAGPRSITAPTAVSPDGRNAIAFDPTTLSYSVTRDGKTVVGKSPIGMTIDGAALAGARPKVTANAIRGTVATPVYKKSQIVLDRNETFVDYGTWGIRLAARDDGVALRFETKLPGRIKVNGEKFSLVLPDAEARCWMKPTWSFGCEEMIPFAETAKDVKTTNGGMLTLPLVYRTDGTTVAVVESDVCDYPVLNLARPPETATLPVVFAAKLAPWPKALKRDGVAIRVTASEDFLVETDGTRTFPWRGFILCDEPMKLAESDLVNALARPQTEEFGWVKPGLVAWDWWSCFDNAPKGSPNGGCTTKTYERFIDFAQKHGIPYVIFDAGWSQGLDIWKFNRHVDVPHLIAYAEKRNVGIILWMASSSVIGHEERVAEHFAKLGAKGFKVDFMDRGDAEIERFLWKFAEACRRNRMVIDYHGVHRPTGMSRTYPNVLNYEGVHGLEMTKWYKGNDREMMFNDVSACFLRMTQGPLDYTPGAMLNYTKGSDYRGSDVTPGAVGTRSRQMAMLVMYEAPLQMLCDSPTHYEKNRECLAFMAATPTVWKDTVALGGTPDTYAALARQAKEETWYAAALGNVEPCDVKIDTKFLGTGEWKAEIFRDGPQSEADAQTYVHETRTVRTGDLLDLHLAACGGFVLKFTKSFDGRAIWTVSRRRSACGSRILFLI